MKNLILLLLATFSALAHAANTYAPTLRDIVVVYDLEEREYGPFLYQAMMDVYLDMKMDSSCEQVRVRPNKDVVCLSKGAQPVKVGTLGEKAGQDEALVGYRVNWLNNVQIKEEIIPGYRYIYSLQVK